MDSRLFQIQLCRAARFLDRLDEALFAETLPLDATILTSGAHLPVDAPPKGEYRPVRELEPWGKLWDSGYFRLTGKVPAAWADCPVWLQLEMGGEVLLFDDAFRPLTSLTNTSIQVRNFKKTLYPIFASAQGGERFSLFAEVAANGFHDTGEGEIGICRHLKFGRFRKEIWDLRNDYRALLSVLEIHQKPPYIIPGGYHWDPVTVKGPANHRAARLCYVLNQAVDAYAENPDNAAAVREILRPELESPAQKSELATTAVGHAHLDIGYLWSIAETKRKACRTFAAQLWNIRHYPGYVFGASQPQLYQFVKERMPRLFEEVKQAVKAGAWELQGGMWVEADCNLASGESLVRQFLHGKNFFRDEFGVEVKNLWLPDVFGYSAALPQIMKLAGCDFFLTQKLSWSEFNRFPHHNFLWRGLAGAEVIAHFPPEDNYNAYLEPAALRFAEDNFQENELFDEFLTLFGAGDGGGGPKMEHIEAGLRAADLEDVPRLSFGRAADFFERLRAQKEKLPLWDGELYFEFHRGTLTNQGRIKSGNRKLEQKFIATEMLLALLPPESRRQQAFDAMWKRFLMYQFHDILPGTSLGAVHDETLASYRELAGQLDQLAGETAASCCQPDQKSITLFQSLNTPYSRLLRLPDSWRGCGVTGPGGETLLVQEEPDGIFTRCPLPPMSFTSLHKTNHGRNAVAVPSDDLILENDLIRYQFRDNGELIRAFDKRGNREFLLPDGGNRLRLYVDRARIFEGWEVEISDRDISPQSARATAAPQGLRGPLRSSICFRTAVGNSAITQTAVLEADSLCLDFITRVDFREERRMLRVSFATAIPASEAVCDIQHGFLRRPTHRNTSWDLARFEFAAHRYIDCSDDRGGAALLNDGKYGYSACEGVLELSLLRSPIHPDPAADAGIHQFTYSFLPHAEPFPASSVIAEAAALNRPPLPLEGYSAMTALPFSLEGEVTVEAFKRAEKSGDWILRLLERRGMHGTARLRAPGLEVLRCDLLEWEEGEPLAPDAEGAIALDFGPFELKTLRIKR